MHGEQDFPLIAS